LICNLAGHSLACLTAPSVCERSPSITTGERET
jgi:hypothetical protein